MEGDDRLVPGADINAPATAACPFLLVYCPEGHAPFGVYVPFSQAGVVVYIQRFIRWRAEGIGVCRAVGGAVFT